MPTKPMTKKAIFKNQIEIAYFVQLKLGGEGA